MTNFDAIKTAAAFSFALGNGKQALSLLTETLLHVAAQKNNDGTAIARLMDKCRLKGDDGAARAIKMVVGEVWKGSKIQTPVNKPSVVALGGSLFNADALAMVETAVKLELSIRSTKLKGMLMPKKAEETAPEVEVQSDDAEATIESVVKETAAAAAATEPRAMGLTAVYALALELSPEDRASLLDMLSEVAAGNAKLIAAA